MKMLKLALAAAIGLFAFNPATAQSPPFNAYSISTLGGNCSNAAAIPYQSTSGLTLCSNAGSPGQVMYLDVGGIPSWQTVAGTGTVTSVGLSLPSIFSVSGSPVSAAGTITGTLASQSANTIFAAPNGVAGTPTFRSLLAADIPAISLTTGVSGVLPVANGGTGVTASTGSGSNVLSASPALTGTPTVPTQTAGDNTTAAASTAFVTTATVARVAKIGDTMTGDLAVTKINPMFAVDKPVSGGGNARIRGRADGLARWDLNLGNSSAEAGSNSGSDFSLRAYDDTGTAIGTVMSITRATGVPTFTARGTMSTIPMTLLNCLAPEDYGAVGNGTTEDAPAFRAMFAVAKTTAQPICLTGGKTYAIKSPDPSDPSTALGVLVSGITTPISVYGNGATIKGFQTIQVGTNPGAILRFESSTARTPISFQDVRFDLTVLTPATPGVTTVGGISISGPFAVTMTRMFFNHGTTTPSGTAIGVGGGDQSVFLSGTASSSVTASTFIGAPDLGLYISGSASKMMDISGNYFYRCQNGVGLKRTADYTIVRGNSFEENDRGIYTPAADGSLVNHGKSVIISDNQFLKIQTSPVDIDGGSLGSIVTGNRFVDWSRLISTGGAQSLGFPLAAVRTRAPRTIIENNYFEMRDWTATSTANNQTTGIIFNLNGNYTDGAIYSFANDNIIEGANLGISLNSMSNTTATGNKYINVSGDMP